MGFARYLNFIRTGVRNLVSGNFEVNFDRLEPVDIVIWDNSGSRLLIDALSPDTYFILNVQRSIIFLNPAIVWRTLTQLRFRRGGHFESVIEKCQPKAVVTFIDNGERFHKIASRLPRTPFIAFQNGIRWPLEHDDPLPIGFPRRFDSIFFCFGENEFVSFEKMGYTFNQIRPIGSLKNALFIPSHSTSKKQTVLDARFDLGLISQFRIGLIEEHPIKALLGYKDVLELFANYVKSHPELGVCTMLRNGVMDQDYEAEVQFHQQYLGIRANLIPNSEDGWSSYVATEESDVVVSASSALGFESLGRGRKTLICSRPVLRDIESRAFHADWILPDLHQEVFDESIEVLRHMHRDEFQIRNNESINYYMKKSNKSSVSESFRDVLSQYEPENFQ